MKKQKEFKIKCIREFTLTDEDIDDIMCDALEGGITYWCGKCEVVGDYLGEYASEQISHGGELILHDIEDPDEKWTLNRDKLLNGFKLAVEEGYFSGDFDDDYDGGTADVIVQMALFGEVVYG